MYATPKNTLRCALILAACLGGCADTSATYTPLNAAPRSLQARTPEQIQVFPSAPPQRPHVDVGLISVEEGDGDETPAALIGVLRRIAAERGCDALMIAPPSAKTGQLLLDGTRSYKVYSGTCVVYR